MTDEAGADDKIIAVPIDKLNPYYGWVQSPDDLPQVQRDQIAHFFQHYKDLEKGKWVAGLHWVGYEEALKLVMDGIINARRSSRTKTVKSKSAAGLKAAPAAKSAAKSKAAPKKTVKK